MPLSLSVRVLGVLILLFGPSPSGWAQLKWDNRVLEFHPPAQETNVVANFTFKNTGKYPVTIRSVKSSCSSCTTTSLEKKVYPPGEKGKLAVGFSLGDRVGLQEKEVMIQTDDPAESTVMLTMKVHILETLRITPAFVFWQVGEKTSVKTMTLKVN
ncbi:MAG: DUF1573 domain-containing protein [Verrucomicrobia bacterium]|nr:DUF1573 domain-containing protein [Verrucomicrobiota bacterium]